jgi:hypothetical protein
MFTVSFLTPIVFAGLLQLLFHGAHLATADKILSFVHKISDFCSNMLINSQKKRFIFISCVLIGKLWTPCLTDFIYLHRAILVYKHLNVRSFYLFLFFYFFFEKNTKIFCKMSSLGCFQ